MCLRDEAVRYPSGRLWWTCWTAENAWLGTGSGAPRPLRWLKLVDMSPDGTVRGHIRQPAR